jgi:polyferredoxin
VDPASQRRDAGLDLVRAPGLGRFLRWRHARLALQLPLFALALVLVAHGLFGPTLAPKNLSTLVVWVHYRGLLVLVLLGMGNLFCMGCPLLLPRELARRVALPRWNFPRVLRGKWAGITALVGILFAYELFDLWGDPRWTAGLILGIFAAALAVDALFRGAPFCKHVCPIGQFNFVSSTISPFEVKARDLGTCASCATKDCIRGRRDPEQPSRVVQRGCELGLFLPLKVGNLDCTFCLDCVHACPHDNVAIALRIPAEELTSDPRRSGIGRLSKRPDLAALAVVFCFGALLNAFGMVSPVYALQGLLADALGTQRESIVLGLVFGFVLIVEPILLLGLAGWLALRLGRSQEPFLTHVTRFAWSLVPLGFGVWVAHYLFHFLTGLWTFVPVTQKALADLGWPILGQPNWGRGGLHAALVQPIEMGFLLLGLVGSLAVGLALARRYLPARPRAGFVPWAALHVLLWAAAVWLLSQPMEMRGVTL